MAGLSYTEPLIPFLFLIGLAGIAGLSRYRRARVLIRIAFAGLFIVSWPPLERVFALPLEWPYLNLSRPEPGAQAIVVLAGSGDPAHPELPVAIPGPGSYARCRYAAWLYHNWNAVPVIVSGGVVGKNRPPVAAVMSHVIRSEGVPASSVLEEAASMNTKENAKFTAEILRKLRIREIALVVDADSMLRAELCFRKDGIAVIPMPLGHRSAGKPAMLPSWGAVRGNEITLHETLGLVWYKLRGWI